MTKTAGAWCRVEAVTRRAKSPWALRLVCGAETTLDPIRPDDDLERDLLDSTVPCPSCGPETKGAA